MLPMLWYSKEEDDAEYEHVVFQILRFVNLQSLLKWNASLVLTVVYPILILEEFVLDEESLLICSVPTVFPYCQHRNSHSKIMPRSDLHTMYCTAQLARYQSRGVRSKNEAACQDHAMMSLWWGVGGLIFEELLRYAIIRA